MLKTTCCAAITFAVFLIGSAATAGTMIQMTTSVGDIVIELEDEKAPISAKNFIDYVENGFFDDTIFHRVIPGFVIQGGGFTADMNRKSTSAPIPNEADNDLKNKQYSLSMARTPDPDSATSQFFINLRDNTSLDHTGKNQQGWGYAVFGRVVEGQEIVDLIASVKTGTRSGMRDVPLEPVHIKKATLQTN